MFETWITIIIVIIDLNIIIIDCKSHWLSLNFNIWFHIFFNVLVCIKLLDDTLYPHILSYFILSNFYNVHNSNKW
jgi:hypothetical protein